MSDDDDTTGGTRSEPNITKSEESQTKPEQIIKAKKQFKEVAMANKNVSIDVRGKSSANCVIFMRHAETVNAVFPNWIKENYATGAYKQTDLNQPRKLPDRKDAISAYELDSPLTIFGTKVAAILGRELTMNGVKVSAVYSSPAFSCIETAARFIEQSIAGGSVVKLESIPKIRIEPAFFDYASVKQNHKMPKFMTPKELAAAGFLIDDKYNPLIDDTHLEKIANAEAPDDFAKRCYDATQGIFKTQKPLKIVLIVTHARVMHIAAQCLSGKAFKPRVIGIVPGAKLNELNKADDNYPFAAMLAMTPTSANNSADIERKHTIRNACKYHKQDALGGGETTSLETAQWHQMSGMPIFTSVKYTNRFNYSFFLKSMN